MANLLEKCEDHDVPYLDDVAVFFTQLEETFKTLKKRS